MKSKQMHQSYLRSKRGINVFIYWSAMRYASRKLRTAHKHKPWNRW